MTDSTSTSSKKNVIILGGSYSGVSVAHYTLKHTIPKLPKDQYQVILICPSVHIFCRPASPRALVSDHFFNQDKLFADLPGQFAQYPADQFSFIRSTATSLDHTGRTVTVLTHDGTRQTLSFHALVIATGATTPSPLLTPTPNTDALKANWQTFRAALPAAHHILIAGAGPAGVEVAGELGEYLNGRAGWFASTHSSPKVKITLVSASQQILPYLRPDIAKQAEAYLAHVGVTIIKGAKVVGVEPEAAGTTEIGANATVTLSDGRTMEVDLYVPASGMRANTDFIDKALLSEDGRVKTNASTLRVEGAGERVYAMGDASDAARPAVHNVLDGAPVLGANLKRDLLGADTGEVSGEDKKFTENVKMTQLVPVGTSKGVGAMMGWKVPSWAVWLIKGRDYWLWTTGGLWSGSQWNKEK